MSVVWHHVICGKLDPLGSHRFPPLAIRALTKLAQPQVAGVASPPMFDVIQTQLSTAGEKISQLRRFL